MLLCSKGIVIVPKLLRKKTALLLLGLLAQSAFAESQLVTFPASLTCGTWLFQLGGFYAHQGKSQNIGIVDLIGDRFTVTNQNDGNVLIGLGYTINGQTFNRVNLSYGLNAFYLPETMVKGKVIQEDTFTNLSYHYSVNNYPIYFVLKGLVSTDNPGYNVTFDLGLGANIIQTSRVKEKSLDNGITLPDHAFSGMAQTAFSASVGVGIQFNNLFNHVPVECGYRFFYLGQGGFHKQTDQLTNTLKTGQSYANALMCAISV